MVGGGEYERRERIAEWVRREAEERVDGAMLRHYPELCRRALEGDPNADDAYRKIRRGLVRLAGNEIYQQVMEREEK